MVSEVTDHNFEDEILETDPLVLDFWAPWCGPCNMIAPTTEKLSKEYDGELRFCNINVDENHQTAIGYRVMSIPLLLFFKNGQLIDSSLGAVAESMIWPKVHELL